MAEVTYGLARTVPRTTVIYVSAADDRVLQALETAWVKIQEQNPGIASPIFDLTPGREMYCASVSWDLARPIIEFNLMRDGRKVTGAYLLERLLHNAAHALIFEPGKVAPTSGRYHTVAYRDAAQRVGLDVEHNDPEGGAGDGWSETSLAKGTLSHYRNEARRLDRALAAWTPTETPKTSRSRATANADLALCSCQPPRRIRVRESALDKGPIVCSICGQPFVISASASS
jgi:hypothetical protein